MPALPAHPRPLLRLTLVTLAALAWFAPAATVRADEVSFRNEVMAVLSRAGCNQGTCHGNLNGKNGFKLSLRGQDPDFDLAVLTRQSFGRRTNPQRPTESLLLLKATATVPHEGGKRFAVGSREYNLLRAWISAGLHPDAPGTPTLQRLDVTPTEAVLVMPARQVAVRAKALFSDGSRRDVTGLAVFETSNPDVEVGGDGVVRVEKAAQTTVVVRYLDQQVSVPLAFVPARPDFVWSNPPTVNYIDRHVFARLKQLRMNPSALAADEVFVRRAYLDALGVLPTAAETRAFLADKRPDRRARLIDALLERPEFADLWALRWSDLLRNEEKQLDRRGVKLFHQWIRQSVATNKPLNEFARELIASRGSTYTRRPATTTGPCATRRFAPRRRRRCSSASACSAPNATTTRSTSGRRRTITGWRRSSRACSTRFSATTAGTNSTSTSSTANRSCGWTARVRSSTPSPGRCWRRASSAPTRRR